jgi:serine/threonine protein kinase
MAARFRREARAAASVRHPNVVEVYDVCGPDESPFLVMELLSGESLRDRLARGRLSWDEACILMRGVFAGVAAAHRAGIVHRDLKPDNIFLCAVEGEPSPRPKVLDFGVAAVQHSSTDTDHSLTRTGAVIGTPSYMPLEQLTGGEVDVRADIYALGVVLYSSLAGRLPFEAKSASELAVLQATSEPTPLSRACPELRGARERVVMRALARAPGDRFASADAFAAALDATQRVGHSTKWARAALAVALVLLAIVSAFALKRTSQTSTTAAIPVVRSELAQSRAALPAPSVRDEAPSLQNGPSPTREAAPTPAPAPSPSETQREKPASNPAPSPSRGDGAKRRTTPQASTHDRPSPPPATRLQFDDF